MGVRATEIGTFWTLAPMHHGAHVSGPRGQRRFKRLRLRHAPIAKLMVVEIKGDGYASDSVKGKQVRHAVAVEAVVVLDCEPRSQ